MQSRPATGAAPSDEAEDAAPSLLPQERPIDVRPMNKGVAAGTRLKYVRTRPLPMNRRIRYAAVALVAERIDAGHVQHPGIL